MPTAAATTQAYQTFLNLLLNYLRSNDRVFKRELPNLLPGFSENQIRTLTRKAVEEGKITQGQSGYQGAWYVRIPSGAGTKPSRSSKKVVSTMTQKPATTERPQRRPRSKSAKFYNLQNQIPQLLREHPAGLRYLEVANHFGLNRNDATLISVLKSLEMSGIVAREEGKDTTGRKVTYRLASYASETVVPAQPKTVTSKVVDERDQTIEFLLARYEQILTLVEKLKTTNSDLSKQLETFRSAALAHQKQEQETKSRPLPTSLQEKLRQQIARDQELTGDTQLGSKLRQTFQKGHEVGC